MWDERATIRDHHTVAALIRRGARADVPSFDNIFSK
jgi:hypothetical protein